MRATAWPWRAQTGLAALGSRLAPSLWQPAVWLCSPWCAASSLVYDIFCSSVARFQISRIAHTDTRASRATPTVELAVR